MPAGIVRLRRYCLSAVASNTISKRQVFRRTLLSYFVSFPAHERFTTELKPDTAGFFHLPKPDKGYTLQFLSFFVNGNRYGKGKLTITSPNLLELYVNDVKRATKTTANDSLHHSGSVDATLNGFTNNARVIIKLLASAESKAGPAVKIELKPEQEDSLLQFTFNNTDKALQSTISWRENG